jgi:hypothetical protein
MTAHAVASQRREIGIRLALGSRATGIAALVARAWIVPVVAGVIVGVVAGAFASTRLAAALNVEVAVIGWPTVLPTALTIASTLACVVPVLRAVRRMTLVEAVRAE